MLKSSAIVSLTILVSRILGYVRDAAIAFLMGTTIYNDIFVAAFKLTNLFRSVFAEGAFNNAFTPVFSQVIASHGSRYARTVAAHLQALLLLGLLLVMAIMFWVMPLVIRVTTPGFATNQESLVSAIEIARLTFPYLFFISVAAFYGSILNSINSFVPYSFTSVLMNVATILSILIWHGKFQTPAHDLGYAVLLAGVVELLWMLFWAWQKNWLIPLRRPILVNYTKRIAKRFMPALLGSSVMQVNVWIDMVLASFIPSGMSYIYYADRVMQLPLALVGTALGIVMLPNIAKVFKHRDKKNCGMVQNDEAISLYNNGVQLAMAFSIPAAFGLFYLAEDIMQLLFMRGEFGFESLRGTSSVLVAFAVGLPAFALLKIINSVFYGAGDTATPTRIAIYSLISNFVLGAILLQYYMQVGIAIASVVSAYLNCFRGLRRVGDKHGIKVVKSTWVEILKYLFGSVIMVIAIKYILVDAFVLLRIAFGAAIYFAIVFLLRKIRQ